MKTAWIIGNAPSLSSIDVKLLKDHKTFSFNRAYIAYKDWGFSPTYYMTIDLHIIRQMAGDINALVGRGAIEAFFFNRDACPFITPATNTHFLSLRDARGFDPGRMCYCGDVAACSLQVAYMLGYRDIYIVGVDLDWGEHGDPRPGKDTDHFRQDYESPEVRMSPPCQDGHKQAWRMAIETASKPPYNLRMTITTPDSYLRHWLPYVPFEEAVHA
jgi:hypothetical protein